MISAMFLLSFWCAAGKAIANESSGVGIGLNSSYCAASKVVWARELNGTGVGVFRIV